MDYPELRRGNKGEAVVRLQTELNKVGAMLIADGDYGGGTERGIKYAQDAANQPQTGIADQSLWQWLDAQPVPFAPLAINGVAFIALEETGGLRYFNQVTRWPHYPGEASGVTIGVGYDLRFNTADDFHTVWGPHLPANVMTELAKDIGQKGTKKRVTELKNMGIEVPFKAAWPVFVQKTLPRFYDNTESIYPSISRLPDICRSVLVSIVFNRGASLRGGRRTEMRAIRDILAKADSPDLSIQKKKMILSEVEDEIVGMKRLWGVRSGLAKRRQTEANLWRQGLLDW